MPPAFAAARYLYVVFAPRIGKFAGWGREGRVDRYWVSQAASLSCAERKFDTLPAALVAPNGYTGVMARIYKFGGQQALSHPEVRTWSR